MLQMPNYTYWGAFLGSATYLLYPITFMIILFENMLPTTAEAYGAGCKRLTELYVSYGFKYWGLFGILIFVIFSFFVNTFLSILLPPLFRPMGFFIGFYAITKVFSNLGDYSRLFLVSIDKISHYVLFVTLEQILRVGIMLALITRISHPEYLLIFGELPGAIFKSILTWIYTNKKILKVRINIWQTIIAPSVASMLILLIGLGLNPIYMNAITQFNGDALIPTIIYSLFVCLGLALTLYPFIVGILGGWDSRSLQDFEFAAYHSGPSKLFAVLFYKMSRIGSKISPLFNRFPTYDTNIDEEIQVLKVLKEKSREIK
jgi:O-antigen/teichoic acid export membrane protein